MKRILIAISFAVMAVSARSQVHANRELQGLITQSFGYFPKVKEAENAVATSKEKVSLTQLNRLPEVEGDATYNYVQPKDEMPFNGQNFLFAPVHNVNAAFNAGYALFDFGRVKANVQKTKDELQYATHNVEFVKNQLASQVATVYYNIVYLQKAISIQDSVLAYLTENKQIVESKLRNGDALKIDLLNIQSDIDAEQNRKVDLKNQLQKQLNLLEYATGTKQSTGVAFDFDINLADTTTALNIAQLSNSDFLLAEDKIKQAQSDVAISKLTYRPSVNVSATAGYKNGYIPDVTQVKFDYAAGISLNIPIYNGGKTKQQVKLAQTVVKQNELALESLNNTYKKDIDQAVTDINTNLERIKNTGGQIEEAKAAEILAADRFKDGVGTNLEITNASTNVERAELTKLQYEYQLCLSKLELARLLGYQYW